MQFLFRTASTHLFQRSFYSTMFDTQVLKVVPENFTFKKSIGTDEFSELNANSVISTKNDKLAIEKAVEWLKKGEAVGIPTETVYGLAANALDANAVSKIFAAKNRPQDNPLIVHVSSINMLKSILPDNTIPEVYLPIIRKHWPGPLTIVLPTSQLIPNSVTCGHPTVAVRFPSHPVARSLIEACGFPLAAPSANSSGKPSPTLASHVYHDLQGRIPFILDGGSCNVGVESTVLDGLRNPPAILRPGGLTYEELKEIKGMEQLQVYRKDFVDKELEMAPTTPGMKYRHYSPEAMVILIDRKRDSKEFEENFEKAWKEELNAIRTSGMVVSKIGMLRTTQEGKTATWETISMVDDQTKCISLQMGRYGHPEEVARGMFKGLRELDGRSVNVIFVEGIPEDREGMAVMNRLRKAATKVLEV
ncbi:DHBP synthase RibB-like alpha/beta domain-containing protein [Cokeromyces recurvatus]|uniref:DHBP synthase RibB-like alpha/beta domain-containing protein n=1 Tax=Cokeromyces recurvatus TaxID=90255 RepID=UPI00221E3BC2|nr:DHBP synthase RibB-like alpha/beta domain-containing protein [Cokeromyces recurvatus]KAI7907220.1 DHBP synthase RibB-like alpha/beta domain-containing protein [Cokeromyces recurvatus]